ncbi:hypothetical protein CLOHYLEM_07018 [[Clostridium] hylemonae DSM 15053]|uniref:Uncharacterized protein n=1 Tax=[Clostridium] hylemonae DSM 15053 TaxID=553973 RepID=C0C4K2_9FIRM|nr:hypothetical protein CLOHYLEM_07018 [[Clostridium] hylemonae DSM 15053]
MLKKRIKYCRWRHVKRKKVKELSERSKHIENKNIQAYTLYQTEQGGRRT